MASTHKVVSALTILILTAAAAPAVANPLEREMRSLMLEHPMLKSLRHSVEAAGKGRDVAASGYFPRLSVAADTGRERIRVGTVTTDFNRRRFTTTLEQNLYAGGRTAASVEVADFEFAAQENNLRMTTQDVLFEAITAYVQAARFQTLIAIARRNERTTQRQLILEHQRVELGGGIAVDVMQARSRLHLVKERRVFYEQSLRDVLANYEQVFGHPATLGQLQDLSMYKELIPPSLEAALAQAREHNPRLKDAALQSKKAQSQVGVERAGMRPTVDLVGTHINDRNVNAIREREESSVLVRLNWNLFAGFETKSRTQAADYNHSALLDREVAVTSKVEEAVRVSWNQLINGQEREELLRSASALSYDVMQHRKRLRDAGKETAINVLDAEVEYYAALSNKLNANYDSLLGSYRLLASIGALTPNAIGLTSDQFKLPVKPLLLDDGRLDAEAVSGAGASMAPAKSSP